MTIMADENAISASYIHQPMLVIRTIRPQETPSSSEAKDDVAGHLEGCVQGGLSREEHAKLNWGQTCARSSGALWNDGNGGGEARG